MDPITDMFNRIKTAYAVKKEETIVPASKLKKEILLILKREGFIRDIKEITRRGFKFFKVILKYDENNTPALTDFKKISKPGQRIYQGFKEIKKVKGGYGISIISTSQGVMTNKEAKKKKVGGEILVEVW